MGQRYRKTEDRKSWPTCVSRTGASPAGGIGGIAPPIFIFALRFISCPPTAFFLRSEHRPHS